MNQYSIDGATLAAIQEASRVQTNTLAQLARSVQIAVLEEAIRQENLTVYSRMADSLARLVKPALDLQQDALKALDALQPAMEAVLQSQIAMPPPKKIEADRQLKQENAKLRADKVRLEAENKALRQEITWMKLDIAQPDARIDRDEFHFSDN